jgi:hypothetical protein
MIFPLISIIGSLEMQRRKISFPKKEEPGPSSFIVKFIRHQDFMLHKMFQSVGKESFPTCLIMLKNMAQKYSLQ